MKVLSDVEGYAKSKAFHQLVDLDEDNIIGLTVRYVHYPHIEDLVEDEQIQVGYEIRFFRDEEPTAAFVEDIEGGVLVIHNIEDGLFERVPFGDFIKPILIIDPYQ